MFNGLKINKLLEERGITKVNLFTHIGISKKGLDDICLLYTSPSPRDA